MKDEDVLVVPASALESVGRFTGLSTDVSSYLNVLLSSERLLFLPRRQAEDDPRYVQVVPYAILQFEDHLFSYQRGSAGSERRLHALWSIGVGGHICRDDVASGTASLLGDGQALAGEVVYTAGFQRELAEEVIIAGPYEQKIIGIVHDPRTPVGQVHCGIVHLLQLSSAEVQGRDMSLSQAGLRSFAELRQQYDRLETWSQFVFDHLQSVV